MTRHREPLFCPRCSARFVTFAGLAAHALAEHGVRLHETFHSTKARG